MKCSSFFERIASQIIEVLYICENKECMQKKN